MKKKIILCSTFLAVIVLSITMMNLVPSKAQSVEYEFELPNKIETVTLEDGTELENVIKGNVDVEDLLDFEVTPELEREFKEKEEFIKRTESNYSFRKQQEIEQNQIIETEEDKRIMREAKERATIEGEITLRTINQAIEIINNKCETEYVHVIMERLDMNCVQSAVELVQEGKLNAEEEEIIKGYLGETYYGIMGYFDGWENNTLLIEVNKILEITNWSAGFGESSQYVGDM